MQSQPSVASLSDAEWSVAADGNVEEADWALEEDDTASNIGADSAAA